MTLLRHLYLSDINTNAKTVLDDSVSESNFQNGDVVPKTLETETALVLCIVTTVRWVATMSLSIFVLQIYKCNRYFICQFSRV